MFFVTPTTSILKGLGTADLVNSVLKTFATLSTKPVPKLENQKLN